jgi:methyl-accepting chemotaxis protein
MSGTAAKEIGTMLETSTRKAEDIAHAASSKINALVEGGRGKMEEGQAIASQCGEVFNEIAHFVGTVSRHVDEISGAVGEESRGVNEISKAMNQISVTTQESAKIASQNNEQASILAEQTQSLEGIVKTFEAEIKVSFREALRNTVE